MSATDSSAIKYLENVPPPPQAGKDPPGTQLVVLRSAAKVRGSRAMATICQYTAYDCMKLSAHLFLRRARILFNGRLWLRSRSRLWLRCRLICTSATESSGGKWRRSVLPPPQVGTDPPEIQLVVPQPAARWGSRAEELRSGIEDKRSSVSTHLLDRRFGLRSRLRFGLGLRLRFRLGLRLGCRRGIAAAEGDSLGRRYEKVAAVLGLWAWVGKVDILALNCGAATFAEDVGLEHSRRGNSSASRFNVDGRAVHVHFAVAGEVEPRPCE